MPGSTTSQCRLGSSATGSTLAELTRGGDPTTGPVDTTARRYIPSPRTGKAVPGEQSTAALILCSQSAPT
jgi:hypothetical protein